MRIAYEEDGVAGGGGGGGDGTAAVDSEASRAERKQAFLDAMKAKRDARSASNTTRVFTGPVVKAQMPKALLDGVGDYVGIDDLIGALPNNYNFEVKKSVWRLLESKATIAALQFPEGLLVYACLISDILRQYAHVDTIIMGDVTYGACCVDDYTAKCLGADFLIHYGHSCLINIADTSIGVQYVFVDIAFDTTHLVETIRHNFDTQTRLAIVGTIQYASSFHRARQTLLETHPHVYVPQSKPLSGGELLGCTSPTLPGRCASKFPSFLFEFVVGA